MKRLFELFSLLIKKNKRLKKWRQIITALAAVLAFITTYALILPAITVEKDNTKEVSGMYLDSESAQEEASEMNPESVHDQQNVLEENSLETKAVAIAADQENAVTYEYADDSISAAVVISTEEEIPEDAELILKHIDSGSDEYTGFASRAAGLLDNEYITEVTTSSFYDFALVCDNADVTPRTGLADIQITFRDNTVVHTNDILFAGRFALPYGSEDGIKATSAENTAPSDELVSANPDNTSVIELTDGVITGLTLKGYDLSRNDSIVGLLGGILNETAAHSVNTLTASGDDYTVNLTYDETSGVPRNATLEVSEIAQGSDEYEAYLRETKKAMGLSETDALPQYAARFFDIKIMVDGQEFRPDSGVTVEISYAESLASRPETEVSALHFSEDSAEPEVIDASTTDIQEDGTATVEFQAESFSVYGVIYTVDIHYEVNGKTYDISIPGGGFTTLYNLVETLGINQNDTEDKDASLTTSPTSDGSEVSEATKAFVADIESVVFSDPDLVWIGKVEETASIGSLKEANGLEVQYSAELTEEDINAADSSVVASGDWALISVRPFETEETMAVTMKNGEQFEIKITDASYQGTAIVNLDNLDADKSYVLVRNGVALSPEALTGFNNRRLQGIPVTVTNNSILRTNTGDMPPAWHIERKTESNQTYYVLYTTATENGVEKRQYLHLSSGTPGNAWMDDQEQQLSVEVTNNTFRFKNYNDSANGYLDLNNNEATGGFQAYNNGSNSYFTLYELGNEAVLAKLHFVDSNGNAVTGVTFNGEQIEGDTFEVTESWVKDHIESITYPKGVYTPGLGWGQEGSFEIQSFTDNCIDLNKFALEGYTLSNTHRGDVEGDVADLFSESANEHTIVDNMFKWSDNNLQYWAYYTGDENSGGGWFNIGTEPNNWDRGGDHSSAATDNIIDYYLVFDPIPASSGSGGQGQGGGLNPEDLDKIHTEKNVGSNHDGTYDVTLGVTGSAIHEITNPHANVIIVFDTSSSMVSNQEPPVPAGQTRATRLQRGKEAINGFARRLLAMNTDDPDKIELALISFNRDAETHLFSGASWTKDYDAFSSTVGTYTGGQGIDGDGRITDTNQNSGLNTLRGTNWAQAFDNINDLTLPDNDPTYVLFFTDGAPSQYWELNSSGEPMFYVDSEGCYFGARDEARETVRKGYEVFGVFAYGDSIDEENDFLGKLMKYAYNGDDNFDVNAHRINASNTSAVETALTEILNKIGKDLGYEEVAMHDGITELSHTTLVDGTPENFRYKICKYTVTTDDQGNTVKQVVEGSEATVTPFVDANNKPKLRVEFPGKTVILNQASFAEIPIVDETTGEVVSTQKEVTWEFGDDYMLEDGYTYELSFTIWPSQQAYDLVANLQNELIRIEEIEDKEKAQLIVDVNGNVYTFDFNTKKWTGDLTDEQLQNLIDQDPINVVYALKTNTHSDVDYKRVYMENGQPVGDPVTVKGEEIKDPHGRMNLDVSKMKVEKKFSHLINAQDPYTKLQFFVKVDGKYYNKDGSFSSGFDAEKVYAIDLPKDGNWWDEVFIAPGLIRTDDTADNGVLLPPYEPGHEYTLEEIITDGSVYEYEFTPQVVRPMVIGETLTFLVKQDQYNAPGLNDVPADAKTYVIGGSTYFVESKNNGSLTGTNRKTAELDITKIVRDPDNKLTDKEEAEETFTYRVTLEIPDKYPDGSNVDPAGIVGYEYIQRPNQANAFYAYGYHVYTQVEWEASGNSGTPPVADGFEDDVARLGDLLYRRWNTLAYRDLVEWESVNGRIVSKTDANGNILWIVPNVDGYHSITYDMTLKQDEIIRFTNLPTGTKYTIQEIYANKYPADNAGGVTSGRAPISDPSNISEEGYEITQIRYTKGTRNGDTVSGTIEERDVRYYNQFTNTVRDHKGNRVELKVRKVVKGYEWLSEYYGITLTPSDCTYTDGEGGEGTSPSPAGPENSTVNIYNDTEDHTLSFGYALYKRPGVYKYTISEYDNKANLPYIIFASPFEITVTVNRDANGKLYVAEVSDNSGINDNTILISANPEGTTVDTVITTMTNVSNPVVVKKVDSVTGTVTDGAVFELHLNGEKLYFDPDNRVLTRVQVLALISSEGSEITDITSAEAEAAMENAGITSSFTIGEISLNGCAMTGYTLIDGVIVPDTPTVYELVEITSPDGYLITDNNNYFKVQGIRTAETNRVRYSGIELRLTDANGTDLVDDGGQPKTTNKNATVAQNSLTVALSNEKGAELPHTGGPGTLLYTLSGLALILASALMYGFRMRRRERRSN